MAKSRYNFRGIVGVDVTENTIKQFAKGVANYIYSNKFSPMIIVGKDNRESSDYVLSVVKSVLLSSGISVCELGVVSTPQLVYITKKFRFNLGLMITASHNPSNYNGLKCFDVSGQMLDIVESKTRIKRNRYAKQIDIANFKELYIRELKNQLHENGIECVFDCGNGATVDVVRNVFPRHHIIGNDTSGKYINDGFGSENIETLAVVCKKNNKIGFAFDGDGDRVIAVNEDGKVIDGDKILYILARFYLKAGDKVIGTQISSLALERSLQNMGIGLIREKVGAKYVASRIRQEKALLGGESCGHIFTPTSDSDGVRIAIELLNILNMSGKTFDELLKGYIKTYKFVKNIDINQALNMVEYTQITNDMLVLVRHSATENKLRIYVEGTDEGLAWQKFEQVVRDCERVVWGELCD